VLAQTFHSHHIPHLIWHGAFAAFCNTLYSLNQCPVNSQQVLPTVPFCWIPTTTTTNPTISTNPTTTHQPPPHRQLENEPNCDDIQDALQQITGGRSVPRVFIAGKFIGGGDDTAAKQSSGELLKLLQAAGVDTI
jgi:glutaredoxin